MKLPIDIVDGTFPPRFRWIQSVDTPDGKREVEHLNTLPASVEDAVAKLISLAKKQGLQITALKAKLANMESNVTEPTPAKPQPKKK